MKIFFSDEQIIKYLKGKGYIVRKKEELEENIKKARDTRTREVKEKIKKIIEELKEKGEEINAHKISKLAGVNYRTARKYFEELKDE